MLGRKARLKLTVSVALADVATSGGAGGTMDGLNDIVERKILGPYYHGLGLSDVRFRVVGHKPRNMILIEVDADYSGVVDN